MSEKRCSKCKRLLPLDAYSTTSSGGRRYLRADCKQCVALRTSEWWLRTKAQRRAERTAYMRTWRARDRETYNKEARRMRIARTYKKRVGAGVLRAVSLTMLNDV